jgi:RNA polymerase sigma-70 factor (ECF subfamily)
VAVTVSEVRSERGEIIDLPQIGSTTAIESALDEMDSIYAFVYSRVGTRADAEDLTQQVALKALGRLRGDAAGASIRAYLFATARSVLATFWSRRFGLPEDELPEDVPAATLSLPVDCTAQDRVTRILRLLPDNYRRVLELRFLRGYALKEVADELGTTVGNVKVMQLRALRAAAKLGLEGGQND